MRITIPTLILAVSLVAGCSGDDEPIGIGPNTALEIISDPAGGYIELDGVGTGRSTPATLTDVGGRHELLVRRDRDGIRYGFRTEIEVRGDSLHRVIGPLMVRCALANTDCLLAAARDREFGRLRISTQANGALFMRAGQGHGLVWPPTSGNSYVSVGMPLIAMVSGPRDTLSLGIYDLDYLAGRPEPVLTTTPELYTLRQSTWLLPPTNAIINNIPTVRGIEIEEELIGSPDNDVAFLRLTFRNITDRASYRAADPVVPTGGMRFDNVYIGFALDPDIGVPEDDMVTYEPDLDLVYAYDYNFHEAGFSGAHATMPGLIGLKLVQAPATASSKSLNAWPAMAGMTSNDWRAGTNSEAAGYGTLSGLRAMAPDYPGQLIGHTPTDASDYRISVSVGPVTLEPGATASITVAIIVAAPVQGEFVSGQAVEPGSPTATDRQISRIAATLLDRARLSILP